MASPEGGMSLGPNPEFQPKIQYNDVFRSPTIIARQADTLLKLLHKGAIPDSELAKDYLQKYTFSYLNQATVGAGTLFDKHGAIDKDLDLEIKEMAQHAYIVFSHLPDNMTSRFLPNGFSRRGMVRAPETKDEFVSRLEEIKLGIWEILDGRAEPPLTLETHPRLFRTFGFFDIGSKIPVKAPEDPKQKEQMEKDRFNALLKDINVSL